MKKVKGKSLIALILIAVLGIVGGTFAFFTSTDVFSNVFKAALYDIEVTETFTSPTGWTPGTTTIKKVFAQNNGSVDAAVRISYTESWTDAEGNILPLEDKSGEKAAIINFSTNLNSNWILKTESDGVSYYYYKNKLLSGESTDSIIESVTFNKDVDLSISDLSCEEKVNEEGISIKECRASSGGYTDAVYTLNVKVETAQFDHYKTMWNTSVEIN